MNLMGVAIAPHCGHLNAIEGHTLKPFCAVEEMAQLVNYQLGEHECVNCGRWGGAPYLMAARKRLGMRYIFQGTSL